ncbi:related to aspartate--tRNA ligase, mitochondrial [Ustilago trichophora]|uniref:Related to aspartate--tRNA ligase, mitochondrial n=1 Tax=Ustilago trichophora TaxID=86804 RepID=A0A5C3EN78_9BASI|nr:related to aspartate--tRNA ligase, mitochondrial [Ustilago trichophora]
MLARNVRVVGRQALRHHCVSSSASLRHSCCFVLVAPPHGGAQPRTRTYATTAALHHPDALAQPSPSNPTNSNQSLAQDAFYGAFPSRTHNCGQLSPSHADQQVILTGWLQSSRQVSKQLAFLTIFDHTGSVQLKVQPTADSPSLLESLTSIPLQSAVLIRGKVALRPSQDSNATLSTGSIEILPSSFTLLNPATRDLPFQPSDSVHADGVSAELRARYRYLDLRRPSLAENIRLRSRVTHAVRNHLYHQGFLEIETPVLLRSTPEGAREFLVPTRTSSTASTNTSSEPTFYALPQSPQQPKQLLIASGVTDKYFQIAKCFRDEDGRKDRQPEFTQIDLEMGFVSGGPKPDQPAPQCASSSESKDADSRDAQGQWRIGGHQVRQVIEGLVSRIWQVAGRGQLSTPFPVMSYWTAMTRYGSDKPDLRYDLTLHDISSGFLSSSSDAFEPHVADTSLEILPYHHSSIGSLSKKELDTLLHPFKGKVERFRIASPDNIHELAALLLKKSALTRSFLSQLPDDLSASEVNVEHLASVLATAVTSENQTTDSPVDIFISTRSNPPEGGSTTLGDLRKTLAAALVSRNLLSFRTKDTFTWITEFPLFTLADEDKNQLSSLSSSTGSTTRWQSSHHPFTAPVSSDIPLITHSSFDRDSIAKVRGQHYDLVLNGQEIGGGSVRIHSRALQEIVFRDILKLDESERQRFKHLVHALDCGAPPHGGMALGFDRLMAILCNVDSIRDVIAFPKQGSGSDPLFGSPAPLRDLHESQGAAQQLLHMYGLSKAKTSKQEK